MSHSRQIMLYILILEKKILKKKRNGTKVHTSTGPLDNSYSEYKYANTYGD